MVAFDSKPDGVCNKNTAAEVPVDQFQALELLKQAGKAGDKSGFKPASFDIGILGGAAAGAFTAEELLKDRNHKLYKKFPERPADTVTKFGAKIWNNEDGKPAYEIMQSGARYKFDYKNGHLSQLTLPDGSYYSCKSDLKGVPADDGTFEQRTDRVWQLQSRVNKSELPSLSTMSIEVDKNDGSVEFKHRNGAQEIFTANGFEVDVNPEKEINKVVQAGGDQWTFDYNLDHDLSRITKKSASGDSKMGEVYAPSATLGLWTESTLTGPVTGFPLIAARDPESGNVILCTKERAIVFSSEGGKSEATWKQLQDDGSIPSGKQSPENLRVSQTI